MIGTQAHAWMQLAHRGGRPWPAAQPRALAQAREAGLEAWEPIVLEPAEAGSVAAAVAAAGLAMPSIYTGGVFHDGRADATLRRIVALAEAVRPHRTRMIVVNPAPLDDGGDKSDAQLAHQRAAFQRLGHELRQAGVTLCYHAHAPEMRAAAREYHHMLAGTEPAAVRLCLDTHWVYRGAGNSNAALLDIARLYADRVACIHLRQSCNGVWAETVDEGDVDHRALVAVLRDRGVGGVLLTLERAVEAGTPTTMSALAAHRASADYVRRTFAPLEPA